MTFLDYETIQEHVSMKPFRGQMVYIQQVALPSSIQVCTGACLVVYRYVQVACLVVYRYVQVACLVVYRYVQVACLVVYRYIQVYLCMYVHIYIQVHILIYI